MTCEQTVASVVDQLHLGAVVIIPTDTVYGLAADPKSERAMARLFALKRRPLGVPVALLVGSVDAARRLIDVPASFDTLTDRHWPGALTIVANGVPDHGLHIGDVETLGVRMPAHDLVLECATRFGPIAATSANRHGKPTITSPGEVRKEFGAEVDLIVDGGELSEIASTVVSLVADTPAILRQGEVQLRLGECC